MNIKKGDTIKIITGKDRGKTGKVLKVSPADSRILVEGLNIYKKNVKPKKQGEKGQTISLPRPFKASNALIVCVACGKATRVGYNTDNNQKTRFCKNCKASI